MLKEAQQSSLTRRGTRKRKEEHLRISLEEEVQSKEITNGLEEYTFIHQALPELDLTTIDISTSLFGKKLSAPIVISSMVGGIQPAGRTNRRLAKVAQIMNIAMGVG